MILWVDKSLVVLQEREREQNITIGGLTKLCLVTFFIQLIFLERIYVYKFLNFFVCINYMLFCLLIGHLLFLEAFE